MLASTALLALRARRRQQFRERRPGRAIAPAEPRLAPVEKTITVVGTSAAPSVHTMDQALRSLATTMIADRQQMPALVAVNLRTGGAFVLHLTEPTHLPGPYPLLVSCGSTEHGDIWLVYLEQLGAVRVAGDLDYRGDYLRYIVAELALNPWSANTTIICTGLDDLTALNPERVRITSVLDDAIDATAGHAAAISAAATTLDIDAPTARAGQLGDEIWPAQVLVAEKTPLGGHDDLSALVNVITARPDRTGTAVISDATSPGAVEFVFTSGGRIQIVELGLDLIAVGLTRDEALGCAQLLSVSTSTQDVPMPATDDLDASVAIPAT